MGPLSFWSSLGNQFYPIFLSYAGSFILNTCHYFKNGFGASYLSTLVPPPFQIGQLELPTWLLVESSEMQSWTGMLVPIQTSIKRIENEKVICDRIRIGNEKELHYTAENRKITTQTQVESGVSIMQTGTV